MASNSRLATHYETVEIKDSEYARKCGIRGHCYFYVSKGNIKISQLDNKTSFNLSVSRIRNWGATRDMFFLELGTRSPAGPGRLEMIHKDPNQLRILVRDTTRSQKRQNKKIQGPPDESSSAVLTNHNEEDYEGDVYGDGSHGDDQDSDNDDESTYTEEDDDEEDDEDDYGAYSKIGDSHNRSSTTSYTGSAGKPRGVRGPTPPQPPQSPRVVSRARGAVAAGQGRSTSHTTSKQFISKMDSNTFANDLMNEMKWFERKTTTSEEANRVMSVKSTTSRDHFAVGDDDDEVYAVVTQKSKKKK